MTNKISIFILLTLVTFSYAFFINNDFLSDDIPEIVNNPNIGSFSNIASNPAGFIRLVLYFLAFHIGGLNEFLFRGINILFHMGNSILIYYIVKRKLSIKYSLISASIFAVHPAIAEGVIWISGGMYAQYAFFFLLSFLFYILSTKKNFFYILSSIFYLLSLMSHPQAPLALCALFPVWEISFGNLRMNWKKTIPFFLIAIAYTFISLTSLPERVSVLKTTHSQEGGIDNIFVTLPIAISSYFELIFFPKNLTLYHSELNFERLNQVFRTVFTFLLLSGLVICFKKNKFVFFFGSLFILGLAPTLLPLRLNSIVAERYLYLPIIGIIVLFAFLAEKLFRKIRIKNLDVFVFGIIIFILLTRTIIRNNDWKNQDSLWIAASKTSPSSPNNHNNLGDMYGRWGDKQKAIEHFKKAIALKPNYADAYHNLGNAYRDTGDAENALKSYSKALEINPTLWQSHQNIAYLFFAQKQYGKAIEHVQKAILINPQNLNLINNLGIIYLSSGDKVKAKEIFYRVLSSDPQNQIAKQSLAETDK
jgi:tetratricopeptide (TPR) repeat protein